MIINEIKQILINKGYEIDVTSFDSLSRKLDLIINSLKLEDNINKKDLLSMLEKLQKYVKNKLIKLDSLLTERMEYYINDLVTLTHIKELHTYDEFIHDNIKVIEKKNKENILQFNKILY